ncbi:MAG TPA: hypothetical protein VN922_14455 [Bacteroidia bacterium]|nr:hypothetical protein [Bacteroidia bacterium]
MQRDGVQEITATSGTQTVNDATGIVYVNPATLAATLTLKMPPNPQDQDIVNFQFGGTITGVAAVVSVLTMAANTGQSLVGAALTAANSGNSTSYQYRKSNTTWYKLF